MASQGNPGEIANGHTNGHANGTANGTAHGSQQQGSDDAGGGGSSSASRYSQSQYAEAIANPLPELAVVSVPEPVSNLAQMDCDDAASTRPVVQPDDIGDRRGSAVVYAGEKPSRWRKYRTPVIIALVVAVLVLIATVVGVVVSNNNKDRSVGAESGSSHLDDWQLVSIYKLFGHCNSLFSAFYGYHLRFRISVFINVAVFDGDRLCIPYPCDIIPFYQGSIKAIQPGDASGECADSSDFLTSVSFMGVKGAPGNGGWTTSYYGASDSKDCCAHCFKSVSAGCNSWAYMPSGGFVGTSCAMITGWDTGDDKDSTCPSGHGATVYFTRDSDNSSDVGAAGPCGVIAD
ncbi:hypothetical protein N8I77_010717 [Diaporthe amygdali]|uniref:Uncharacterized protein n=1 Tax=Phomopsis amygdali TaxID=1214568 RepID=A0AAD9VZN1_PHOAM|nr:hypothetical protein N8I77_010717 [Diaporthe amygdali]